MHCAFLVHSLGSRVIHIPAQKGHPSKAGVKTLVAKSVDQCWNSGFVYFVMFSFLTPFFPLSVCFPHIFKGELVFNFNSCSVMS